MATALAQQLRQLAVASGRPVGTRNLRGKASIIWSPQEAADIDNETVYQLGREGFKQLCQIDSRFGAYETSLFGPGAKDLHRGQQSPDVVAALDAAIAEFCTLLSPVFLLPAASQALEWLIRGFGVQEHNVASVMTAALPSHATNEFVRLVQVCSLRGTLFEFLEPMQASGAALPRPTLVQRCLSDAGLLGFVLDLGRALGTGPLASRPGLPFVAATLCEFLAEQQAVTEKLSAQLLPYIVAGLAKEALPDYRAATLMVLSQLAVRTALSEAFLNGIVLDVCRSAKTDTLSSTLLVLMTLASRQSALAAFPVEAYRALAALPGLVPELAALEAYAAPLEALLALLVPRAVEAAPESPALERLLEELLAEVPLGSSRAAERVAREVFASAARASFAARASYRRALRTLDLRYPAALDAAVEAETAALLAGTKQGAKQVEQLLLDVFPNTKRAPLEGGSGLSLQLAVDGPTPALRAAALRRLDALLAEKSATDADAAAEEETAALRAFLVAAVQRRLADEDAGVVCAALSLAATAEAAAELLRDVLGALDRAVAGVEVDVVRAASRVLLAHAPAAAPETLLGLLGAEEASPEAAKAVAAEARAAPPARFPLVQEPQKGARKQAAAADHPTLLRHALHDASAANSLVAAYAALVSGRALEGLPHLEPLAWQCVLAVLSAAFESAEKGAAKQVQALARDVLGALCSSASSSPASSAPVLAADDVAHVAMLKGALERLVAEDAAELDVPAAFRCFEGHADLVRALVDRLSAQLGADAALEALLAHAATGSAPGTPVLARGSAEGVQVTSLGVAAEYVAALDDVAAPVLGALLAALSSEMSPEVRRAGLRAARALLDAERTSWCGAALADGVRAALSRLDAEGTRVGDDAGAAAAVVGALLAQGLERAAAPAAKTPAKRGKTPKKAAKPDGDDESLAALAVELAAQLPVAAAAGRDAEAAALLGALASEPCAALLRPRAAEALLASLERADPAPSALLTDLFHASDGAEAVPVLQAVFASKHAACAELKLEAAAALAREAAESPWARSFDETDLQEAVLPALLAAFGGDAREEVRRAVGHALRALPVKPTLVAEILRAAVAPQAQGSVAPATPARKKSKAAASEAADALRIQEDGLRLAQPALEVLQTHPLCEDAAAARVLLPVLEGRLLAALVAEAAERTSRMTEASDETWRLDYLSQLVLSVTLLLSSALADERADDPALPRLDAVVRFVLAAPGPESLAAALALAGRLAASQPSSAVQYALTLLSAGRDQELGGAFLLPGSRLEATVSEAAVAALAAAAPGYLAQAASEPSPKKKGRAGAPKAPARLPELVQRVVAASRGKPVAMRVALVRALAAAGGLEQTLVALLLATTAEGPVARSGVDDAALGDATTLASALIAQHTASDDIAQALASLLEHVGSSTSPAEVGANGKTAVDLDAIERCAAFVAEELARATRPTPAGAAAILARALALLQALAGADPAVARAATRQVERVLQELQRHVEGHAFVAALLGLVRAPGGGRKAVALLTQHAQRVAAEGAALEPHSVQACCRALGELVSKTPADAPVSSFEVAFLAIGAVAAASARAGPKPSAAKPPAIDASSVGALLELLPAVLAHADADQRPAVRASALAAAASLARALGARLLPRLPATIATAVEGLSAGLDELEAALEGSDGEEEGAAPASASGALPALAALALLDALVASLGAFLAPHAGRLTLALLRPVLLVDEGAAAPADAEETRRLAARVRARLVEAVPVRLLLEPLLGLLEEALRSGGERAALGLVSVVQLALPRLSREEVAAQHGAVVAFLLRALALSEDAPALQRAAVDALCALTLRLSEAQFRPLFVRLHDWAAGETGARRLAFWGAVNGLADQLRAILVPYYKLILPDALDALREASGAAAAPEKKRRKKGASAPGADWRVALRVVRALHRAFLYDTVEPRFLEDERVSEIVPALVRVLAAEPARDAEPALAADPWPMERVVVENRAGAEEGAAGTAHEPSALQTAAGSALVQLAASCGRDPVSKSLHHAVLLLTRERRARTRVAAIRTVTALAEALGEEYLVLLPEALPFIAELLEDGDREVEAAAQSLFKQLEQASGEDLGQYLRA